MGEPMIKGSTACVQFETIADKGGVVAWLTAIRAGLMLR